MSTIQINNVITATKAVRIFAPENAVTEAIMKGIYGYKEEDVRGLAELLNAREGGTLTEIFGEYSRKTGKARGTVRNLYYAMAKLSARDENFCKEYLGGKPLAVEKITAFKECEEKALVKKVLTGKASGRSVRRIITEMAGGDAKTALRLQNKFRAVAKNNPELIEKTNADLKKAGVIKERAIGTFGVVGGAGEKSAADAQIKKLKAEINGLMERVAARERRENAFLRERLAALEIENLRLKNVLYGGEKNSAASFFAKKRGGNGGGAELGS